MLLLPFELKAKTEADTRSDAIIKDAQEKAAQVLNEAKQTAKETVDRAKTKAYARSDAIVADAKELQKEFPEMVKIHESGYLMVDYNQLIPIIIESINTDSIFHQI
jgi:F0F1-type ATP synthase membrane subunit b/b'